MKKQLLALFITVSACATPTTGYSQGGVIFQNYGETTYAPVTKIVIPPAPGSPGTVGVGSEYTAYLYFAQGTINDPSLLTLASGHVPFSDTSKGFFFGGIVAIPAALGPVTFRVVAWPTDTSVLGPVSPYSTVGAGHSDFFTLPSFPMTPVEFGPGLKPFMILIPEPSATALLALALLLTLRGQNSKKPAASQVND